jgi:hypothetical protein
MFITLTKIHNETHNVAIKKNTKKHKTKTKLLRWDSHSQFKSAGVAKQRLCDHGYGTMIKFASFDFFFVVYKVYLM